MNKKDIVGLIAIIMAMAYTYYIDSFLELALFLAFFWMVVLYYHLHYKEKYEVKEDEN